MMKKCYKFNMVEIALAIAIIAIGISAILVLFPIGINATRSAMDENDSADACEYVANFVRGKCLDHWRQTFENWRQNYDPASPADMPFSAPSGLWSGSKEADPQDDATLTEEPGYTDKNTTPHSGLQKYSNGVYQFNKVSSTGEETFSALVKIWSNASDLTTAPDPAPVNAVCPIYIPDSADTAHPFQPKLVGTGGVQLPSPTGGTVDFGIIAQSVMVEISWPVNAPAEERTKRTFRVDVYNPYYTIQPETP